MGNNMKKNKIPYSIIELSKDNSVIMGCLLANSSIEEYVFALHNAYKSTLKENQELRNIAIKNGLCVEKLLKSCYRKNKEILKMRKR